MKTLLNVCTASLVILAPLSTFAKDCSLGIFKTYTPRSAGKSVCDENGLPAEFAGDLETPASGLSSRGYKAKKFNQCADGNKDKSEYSLISQLGDCVQTGGSINCKLYVALYENGTNQIVFENSIEGA
ncbi:MAG: hypothetical protein ACK5P7_03140 [Bdellovibrio sp.]